MFKLIPQLTASLIYTGIIFSCSGPQLKIQSTPANVQVFAAQQSSKEKKLIGATPLEISFKDLYEKTGGASQTGGDYLILTFESPTLEAEKFLLPPVSYGTSTMNLKVNLAARQDTKSAGSILQRLHNAQKFAQAGQLERAQIEADKALESDPLFIRSISMKGSIYYLQKNYSEATKWFEKALTIDSSFEEALKMLTRIKEEKK